MVQLARRVQAPGLAPPGAHRRTTGDAQWTHAQAGQQAALGRADEQHALGMGQVLEHFEHPALGRDVEVDQQIAAEDEVVQPLLTLECRIEHVADLQIDLASYPLVQLVAFVGFAEMPVAERQLAAPERVAPIDGLFRAGDGTGADVHGVDTKCSRVQTTLEQRHGDRVGLSPVEHGRLRIRSGRRPASSARRLWANPTSAVKDSG